MAQEAQPVIRIGELLVRSGVITAADLSEAEKLSSHMKVQFGRLLIMAGCLTEEALECALAAQGLCREGVMSSEVAIEALAFAVKENLSLPDALEVLDVLPQFGTSTLKLAELIHDADIIEEEKLQDAFDTSMETNQALAEVLVEMQCIAPTLLPILQRMQDQIRSESLDRDNAINELRGTFKIWKRADKAVANDPMAKSPILGSKSPIIPQTKPSRFTSSFDTVTRIPAMASDTVSSANNHTPGCIDDAFLGAVTPSAAGVHARQNIAEAAGGGNGGNYTQADAASTENGAGTPSGPQVPGERMLHNYGANETVNDAQADTYSYADDDERRINDILDIFAADFSGAASLDQSSSENNQMVPSITGFSKEGSSDVPAGNSRLPEMPSNIVPLEKPVGELFSMAALSDNNAGLSQKTPAVQPQPPSLPAAPRNPLSPHAKPNQPVVPMGELPNVGDSMPRAKRVHDTSGSGWPMMSRPLDVLKELGETAKDSDETDVQLPPGGVVEAESAVQVGREESAGPVSLGIDMPEQPQTAQYSDFSAPKQQQSQRAGGQHLPAQPKAPKALGYRIQEEPNPLHSLNSPEWTESRAAEQAKPQVEVGMLSDWRGQSVYPSQRPLSNPFSISRRLPKPEQQPEQQRESQTASSNLDANSKDSSLPKLHSGREDDLALELPGEQTPSGSAPVVRASLESSALPTVTGEAFTSSHQIKPLPIPSAHSAFDKKLDAIISGEHESLFSPGFREAVSDNISSSPFKIRKLLPGLAQSANACSDLYEQDEVAQPKQDSGQSESSIIYEDKNSFSLEQGPLPPLAEVNVGEEQVSLVPQEPEKLDLEKGGLEPAAISEHTYPEAGEAAEYRSYARFESSYEQTQTNLDVNGKAPPADAPPSQDAGAVDDGRSEIEQAVLLGELPESKLPWQTTDPTHKEDKAREPAKPGKKRHKDDQSQAISVASKDSELVHLLQAANFFTDRELYDAVFIALADQDRASEVLNAVGIIEKSYLDAAVNLQKLIKTHSVEYEKAVESLEAMRLGKLKAAELTKQPGIKRSKRRK